MTFTRDDNGPDDARSFAVRRQARVRATAPRTRVLGSALGLLEMTLVVTAFVTLTWTLTLPGGVRGQHIQCD